jgi:sugar lactone lactonase YvrE
MIKWFAVLLLPLVAILVFLLWLFSPIDAKAWTPSANQGLSQDFAPSSRFSNRLFLEGVGRGPEDILIHKGYLYTAYADGRIIKTKVDAILDQMRSARKPSKSADVIEVANTGGRPLGLKFDDTGNLIVADAMKGLLSISPSGDVRVLIDEYQGQALKFVDHLAIDAKGIIWFSDASMRFDFHHYVYDFLEASMTGRLFSYNPATEEIKLHLSDLFFANGVAISPKQDYVLVNETGKSRILRYWIEGDKKGQSDVFIDELPAMPDNIYTQNGLIWVALVSLRDPKIESLAAYPALRKIIASLPSVFLQASSDYAFVLALNENAEVVHSLQSDEGYQIITAALEYEGYLFLGSLENDAIAVSALP